MLRNGKITGQPVQQHEESVIVGAPSQRQAIHFAPAQQITERSASTRGCRVLRLRPASGEELILCSGKAGILAGIAVDPVEQYKIRKTDQPRRRKTPAPAKIQNQQTDEGDSD